MKPQSTIPSFRTGHRDRKRTALAKRETVARKAERRAKYRAQGRV